ncbi:MAG: TetR/AcrR family transcriptional regulator [Actinomycetota bacterium]|nr:TetR/AcrR family transcriptional regulator [Actinomycetota bacterium]
MTRTQAQRTEATTAQLVEAARRLFAADGYEATSLDDVVAEAGVTKGALYHHFGSKRDLFRAVYEDRERTLARACQEAYAAEADPWEGFHAGCRAFLEATLDPGVQRICLLDAPAVLGWETVRELDAQYSLAMIENGLRQAIDSGRIAPRPAGPLAHMLMGALGEGAMMVARAEDQRGAMKEVAREIESLLAALGSPQAVGSPAAESG